MHQRTFFMLLSATAHWRALDVGAQRDVFDDALTMVFNGYPGLRMSRFKAGPFHGRCSHVIVWELRAGDADLSQYVEAVEGLHARPFFATPLFEIVDVIPAVEDDEREEDGMLPIPALAAVTCEGPPPTADLDC